MLQLQNVNTFVGPAHVLRGISLTVGKAETVCLVGRNGAGKTTTINSIMCLLPVSSGRITLEGRDITRLPPHEKAKLGIGYAPEDCRVFPDLTVRENLKIAIWLSEAWKKGERQRPDVEERIFALFPELRGLMERKGLYLSGGEKKMLAIARAMALEPSILLLDEALEGLAPVVVTRFSQALAKIKEMGISMLVAESNLLTASKIADRLYAIDRGEIIYEGDPGRAFENEEVMKTIRG